MSDAHSWDLNHTTTAHSRGDTCPFLYYGVGAWDYDVLSNDDLPGLYNKTLLEGWWSAHEPEFKKPHTVTGVDEGKVTCELSVTQEHTPGRSRRPPSAQCPRKP